MLRVLDLCYIQSHDFPAGAGSLYFARWTGYYKVATFELELDFAHLCFTYYTCTTKSRFSSWSWKPVLRALDLHFKVVIFQKPVLRALHLRYKVAIFQLELETCTSRAGLALQSCDFPTRARLLSDTSEHNFGLTLLRDTFERHLINTSGTTFS